MIKNKIYNSNGIFFNILLFLKRSRIDLLKIRLLKLFFIVKNPYFLYLALRGIFPSIEHLVAIEKIKETNSLIDCGSNKGQFFTLLHFKKNFSNLLCFDPLIKAEESINFLKKKNVKVIFKKIAISSEPGKKSFFISERLDCSSLKKIRADSRNYFADVLLKGSISVEVNKLDSYSEIINSLPKPISLKIDVQGSEYDLLLGSVNILKLIKYIFIEINNNTIYEMDSKKKEIINFLEKKGFLNFYNYEKSQVNNKLISEEYLFINKTI